MKRSLLVVFALLAAFWSCGADVATWSETPASNNSAVPDGAPEGMAPSGVNDVIRQNMAEIAEWYARIHPQRWHWWTQPRMGATTFDSFGSYDHGLTTDGTAAGGNDANGTRVAYTTDGTSNDVAGIWTDSTAGVTLSNEDAWFTIRIHTQNITDARIWVGLTSAPSGMTGNTTPAASTSVHYAAFRYDTGADGTAYWRTATGDGSTDNVTTTTTAIAASTAYTLQIDTSDGTSIAFYVDGVLVATHTTNLPGTSQWLEAHASLTALAAAAKSLSVYHIEITHK